MGYSTSKLYNSVLKNGSSSNMAVDGSVTPQVFSYSPGSTFDVEIQSVCFMAETNNSLSFGNKFIDSTISTLTNGLLLEIKANDESYSWQNCKRTRDLVELVVSAGLDIITGTPNFLYANFWLPSFLRLYKQGTWQNDDYLKATVRDNLAAITYMEIFFQGIKL